MSCWDKGKCSCGQDVNYVLPKERTVVSAYELCGLKGLDDFGATFAWGATAAANAAGGGLQPTIADRLAAKQQQAVQDAQKFVGVARRAGEVAKRAAAVSRGDAVRAIQLQRQAIRKASESQMRAGALARIRQQTTAIGSALGDVPSGYSEPAAVAAPQSVEPGLAVPDVVADQLSKIMGTSQSEANAALQTMERDEVGFVPAETLLSGTGAARLGLAGARAAAAAKLATVKADASETAMKEAASVADHAAPGSKVRNRAFVSMALHARQLLSSRAEAERAKTIASGIRVGLQKRKEAGQALAAGDQVQAQALLGQAKTAVNVTQAYAKTPVRVVLPPEISSDAVNAAASAAGDIPPIASTMAPAPNDVAALLPTSSGVAQAAVVKSAQGPESVQLGLRPVAPANLPKTFVPPQGRGLPQPPYFVQATSAPRSGGALMGFGNAPALGDFFSDAANSIANTAKAVVPTKTIVGQLLAGNTAQAAVQTIQLAQGRPTQTVPPLDPNAYSLFTNITGGSGLQTGLLLGAGALGVAAIAYLAVRRSHPKT